MLRIVPHTVPCVGRPYKYLPDGFEVHLLPGGADLEHGAAGLEYAINVSTM